MTAAACMMQHHTGSRQRHEPDQGGLQDYRRGRKAAGCHRK
jgi:hypothetical protein